MVSTIYLDNDYISNKVIIKVIILSENDITI